MVRYRTLTGNGLIPDKWKLVAIAKNGLVLAKHPKPCIRRVSARKLSIARNGFGTPAET